MRLKNGYRGYILLTARVVYEYSVYAHEWARVSKIEDYCQ